MQGGKKQRTELLRIRLTEEEREEIEQRAAENRQTVSDFVRDACQRRPVIDMSEIQDLTRNILKLCVNVNQISATANRTKQATIPQLDAVERYTEQIQHDMGEIVKAVREPHRASEELEKTRRTVLRLLEKLDSMDA